MAIAAECSRSMLGVVCEPNGDVSGIDNIDTDIEIIYRERTAVWCVYQSHRRPCSDFMDMLRRLISRRIIIIINIIIVRSHIRK